MRIRNLLLDDDGGGLWVTPQLSDGSYLVIRNMRDEELHQDVFTIHKLFIDTIKEKAGEQIDLTGTYSTDDYILIGSALEIGKCIAYRACTLGQGFTKAKSWINLYIKDCST